MSEMSVSGGLLKRNIKKNWLNLHDLLTEDGIGLRKHADLTHQKSGSTDKQGF